jgi:hypothetical protein
VEEVQVQAVPQPQQTMLPLLHKKLNKKKKPRLKKKLKKKKIWIWEDFSIDLYHKFI